MGEIVSHTIAHDDVNFSGNRFSMMLMFLE